MGIKKPGSEVRTGLSYIVCLADFEAKAQKQTTALP